MRETVLGEREERNGEGEMGREMERERRERKGKRERKKKRERRERGMEMKRRVSFGETETRRAAERRDWRDDNSPTTSPISVIGMIFERMNLYCLNRELT